MTKDKKPNLHCKMDVRTCNTNILSYSWDIEHELISHQDFSQEKDTYVGFNIKSTRSLSSKETVKSIKGNVEINNLSHQLISNVSMEVELSFPDKITNFISFTSNDIAPSSISSIPFSIDLDNLPPTISHCKLRYIILSSGISILSSPITKLSLETSDTEDRFINKTPKVSLQILCSEGVSCPKSFSTIIGEKEHDIFITPAYIHLSLTKNTSGNKSFISSQVLLSGDNINIKSNSVSTYFNINPKYEMNKIYGENYFLSRLGDINFFPLTIQNRNISSVIQAAHILTCGSEIEKLSLLYKLNEMNNIKITPSLSKIISQLYSDPDNVELQKSIRSYII